jgi:hypothetical protein
MSELLVEYLIYPPINFFEQHCLTQRQVNAYFKDSFDVINPKTNLAEKMEANIWFGL